MTGVVWTTKNAPVFGRILLAALNYSVSGIVKTLHFKPISYSPYSLDILGLSRVELNLFSYLFNVHGYCSNIPDRFHIPYPGK